MEGMPKLLMLHPELKVPASELDDTFLLQIKEYILMHFQTDPSAYDDALKEIQSLKKQVVQGNYDVEAACVLKRYYSQLIMMKTRFPMEKGDPIQVPFSWYERSMEIPSAHTYSDISYELACVMFQIGAVHANIGANESRLTEDSIKNAFMHFQYAAWPFQYLRDSMDLAKFTTPEFDKDILTFYVNVLLGQAQECLLEKSILDHRKGIVVAKLSIYLRDLYMECYKHLLSSSVGEFISNGTLKMWTRTCLLKSELYGCVAMLYMGMSSDDDHKFGDRLGYYQAADVHLQRVVKCCEKEDRVSLKESVRFLMDVVGGKLENAKKENDFIYHERIPKIEDLLTSVEGLCKVKPLAFDPLDPSVGGDDIFASLLPPTVLAAVSRYEEEKANLKRKLTEMIEEKDAELDSFLISLNVSELGLEDGAREENLPEMLLERNAILHSDSEAVPRLLDQLQNVSELARTADGKLSALSSRLALIDSPELTADEGYLAVNAEVQRLMEHHTQARSNNGELHKALSGHTANLHLLTLPLNELKKSLPVASSSLAATTEGTSLLRVLNKVKEMQDQRATLLKKFSEELIADNITKRLLAERDTDSVTTFAAELRKHNQTIQYIEANLKAQASILHHLTEANADFAQQRIELQKAESSRSDRIMTLVTAFDVFQDVCKKTNDGKRFYEKLIDRVDKLAIAVGGMESAWEEEKRKRESERRVLDEKMAALRMNRSGRADVDSYMPGNLPDTSAVKSGRPRLGDYMDFYRNKMNRGQVSGGICPPTAAAQYPPGCPSQYPPPTQYSTNSVAQPTPTTQYPAGTVAQPAPTTQYPAGTVTQPAPTTQYPAGTVAQPAPATQYPAGTVAQPPQTTQYQPISVSHYPDGTIGQYSSSLYDSSMPPASGSNACEVPHMSSQIPSPAPSSVMDFPCSLNEASPVPCPTSYHPTGYVPDIQPRVAQSQHQPLAHVQNPVGSQFVGQMPSSYVLPPTQDGWENATRPVQGYSTSHESMHSTTGPVVSQPAHNFPTQAHMASVPPAPSTPNTTGFVSATMNTAASSRVSAAPLPYEPSCLPFHMNPPVHQASSQVAAPGQPGSLNGPHGAPSRPPGSLNGSNAPHNGPPGLVNGSTASLNGPPSSLSGSAASFNGPSGSVSGSTASPSGPPGSVNGPPGSLNLPATSLPNQSSPWHQRVVGPSASPWHSNNSTYQHHQAPQLPPSNNGAVPSQMNQPPSTGPICGSQHTAGGRVSNVDLLSSLLGDLQLPPALQPTSAAKTSRTESQNLQKTAAPVQSAVSPQLHVNATSNDNGSKRKESALPRPAAAVLPMQHTARTMETSCVDEPVLSMVFPSSVSVSPKPPSEQNSCSGLCELLDPEKFDLGEGDRLKLEKRQLHSSIRGMGAPPSMDPSDPLNQLNPYWKQAK